MLVVYVGDERINTMRSEPLLIEQLEGVVKSESYTIFIEGKKSM